MAKNLTGRVNQKESCRQGSHYTHTTTHTCGSVPVKAHIGGPRKPKPQCRGGIAPACRSQQTPWWAYQLLISPLDPCRPQCPEPNPASQCGASIASRGRHLTHALLRHKWIPRSSRHSDQQDAARGHGSTEHGIGIRAPWTLNECQRLHPHKSDQTNQAVGF